MANDAVRADLQKLVQAITGADEDVLDATGLYHDLRISVELLNKVNQKFGTKFDEFRFDSYFPDETQALLSHFARLLGISGRRKSLTFGHLVDVVHKGKWFDPNS